MQTVTDIKRENIHQLYEGSLPYVKIEGVTRFSVGKIFDCGQCFRFEPVEDSAYEVEFGGVAHGKYISVAQSGADVYVFGITLSEYFETFERYLALDVDYDAIEADILSKSDNPALLSAVEYGRGIRILHQESWETVCSFIISQNNNIPRIKKLIAALSESCGEAIDCSDMRAHGARAIEYAFPSAEAVEAAGIDLLKELKTGFRAKYIYDAASKVASGEIDLSVLEGDMPLSECAEYLCRISGVGPKVAACSLLFGFARLDAFPIDVWIKKVIAKYFGGDLAPEQLGAYAGVAQQFLFYYERYII